MNLASANFLLSFCKHCGEDYTGMVPYTVNRLASKHWIELPSLSFLPGEKQKPVKGILVQYSRGTERQNRQLLLMMV